jgi:FixJ family two-component response regulator
VTDQKIMVAVLDDESKMRVALKRLLRAHGFEVVVCETWGDFLSCAESRLPDCLLLDLHMPGISGFEILGLMASLPKPVPTVVITGRDEPGTEAVVRGLGAVEYLLKPLDESTLLQALLEAHASRASAPPLAVEPTAGS